jgi:hypothetical protein
MVASGKAVWVKVAVVKAVKEGEAMAVWAKVV